MKSIFYCSNAQSDMFPRNTRSRFENYIDINSLRYLPSNDIEAAIKSVTFDNRREERLLKQHILGIRSNICEYSIKNGEYDKILALFVEGNVNDVIHIDFKNPIFFSSEKELLSKAHFEIIDIDTNTAPNFTVGSPTYIQVVIRKKVQRMKKPFTIFLDSSCKRSQHSYPMNNNMEFTIDLPERLEFRGNWNVVLKSLFIPNKFVNADGIYVKYYNHQWGKFDTLKNVKLDHLPFHVDRLDVFIEKFNSLLHLHRIKIKALLSEGKVSLNWIDKEIQIVEDCECKYTLFTPQMRVHEEKSFSMKNGSYKTLTPFLQEMTKLFNYYQLPFTVEEFENGKVKIKITQIIENGFKCQLYLSPNLAFNLGYRSSKDPQFLRFDLNKEYIAPHKTIWENSLCLSPNLAHMLGFQKYTESKEEFIVHFNDIPVQTAKYTPDIFLLNPRNLIIGCDVVSDTIFGGDHVKLLRLVTNPINISSEILTFDFLQNEYVELEVKEFKSIKIRIADVTGKTVRCESDIPTRLQLLFVNI